MTTKHPISFLVALIVALTINLRQAKAQTFAEVQTKVTHPHQGLTFLGNFGGKFNHRWGLNIFFLSMGKYAQVYMGPTLNLNDGKVVLGTSFGGEQGENGFAPRYAASLFVAHGKVTFLGIVEANNGVLGGDDSGLFYDASLKLKIGKFAVGIKDKRPSGLGPILQVKLRGYTYWAAYLPVTSEGFKPQPDTVLVGFRIGS